MSGAAAVKMRVRNAMNGNSKIRLLVAALLLANVTVSWAEGDATMEQMAHPATPAAEDAGMDFSGMEMGDMEQPMDHSAMGGSMQHGDKGMGKMNMQGGSAPADARDPHAYSDGIDFRASPRLRLADQYTMAMLMVDRLEAVRSDDNRWIAYDFQAMYGRSYDRAVLRAEGEIDNSKLKEATTQLLWSHAVATFWNTQLGLRYDSGEGDNQTWLAAGVQGLAPYWFEVDATGYVGENGRSAVGIEAEYELLLTQRLILQPRLEGMLYGKDDPGRALGSGLASLSAGLRLRYEIRREFAPYIGIEWAGMFGDTADYARASQQSTADTRLVAGLRLWF